MGNLLGWTNGVSPAALAAQQEAARKQAAMARPAQPVVQQQAPSFSPVDVSNLFAAPNPMSYAQFMQARYQPMMQANPMGQYMMQGRVNPLIGNSQALGQSILSGLK